jgi:hypothetical protein
MQKIVDVTFYPDFFDDLDYVPDKIKERFNARLESMLNMIEQDGWCNVPNSFNAHVVENTDIWIGHLTNGSMAWRVLYEVDCKGVLHFWRIVTHSKMDVILKRLDYL